MTELKITLSLTEKEAVLLRELSCYEEMYEPGAAASLGAKIRKALAAAGDPVCIGWEKYEHARRDPDAVRQ